MDDDNWGIGSAGLRYLLGGGDGSCTGWRGDIEFGVGVGAGGVDERELETRTSSLKWDERFVYGAFAGGGVAYHFRSWFSWFMRGRLQVSKAEFIPATFWLSGLTGPQFTAGPVSLYISCGVGYYVNELDEEVGLLPEAGLTLRFGTGGG